MFAVGGNQVAFAIGAEFEVVFAELRVSKAKVLGLFFSAAITGDTLVTWGIQRKGTQRTGVTAIGGSAWGSIRPSC